MILLKQYRNAALLAAGLALGVSGATGAAQAAPAASGMTSVLAGVTQSDAVEKVQYRRGRHHRGGRDRSWRQRHWRNNRRHYDNDWNPAAYIGLGIIGALVSQGLSENAAQSAMQRCDNRFRSFEWDTGLYTTYGGEKRLCPYLR